MGISRFSQKTSNSGQKRHFVRFFLQNGQKKSVIWLIFFADPRRALYHKRGVSNFFITFKGAKFLLSETIFSYYCAF